MTPTRQELFDAYALPDRDTRRVRMNFIESADGSVTLGGRSGALGGETDRAVMQVLRTMADVLMIGAGTVRAEGYGGVRLDETDAAWRRERGLSEHPPPAIVSHRLDIEPEHPFFAEAVVRPFVITHDAAPAGRRGALEDVAEVLVCGADGVDLALALDALAERGMTQVLCEGGPRLFGSLLEAGLVDELCVTIAPRIVGGDAGRIDRGAAEADRRLRLASSFVDEEGYVLLRYAV
ncbi:pyrimidine reductase family protein [Microbacterium immunditiarum]|uniref:Riboflavin-specific deaminase-like protein n=1 Tax=Microbacterium immunditiarum TaxID=337480 RepID=A0A7Y9KKV6_9MICO|nr:pyrimidine reductase family protein [Microbacterium immunditiarum]NYE19583.1 riboflavin-specific deaminase-like protein [Microbacterium immunditiarum]